MYVFTHINWTPLNRITNQPFRRIKYQSLLAGMESFLIPAVLK